MKITQNPHRNGEKLAPEAPFPSIAASRVADLLKMCPAAKDTPLVDAQSMAKRSGVAAVWVKDERSRMNLGSFKALGAAYVIARQAVEVDPNPDAASLRGRTYVTASAGNHGMSVAAGARIFGASAIIYIAETVPESFAGRLEAQGAEVRRHGADYAASMEAAAQAATDQGWTLLSDSSWDEYIDLPYVLMEGYLQMAAEVVDQCLQPPTHVILQAGVGGMAGAVAAYVRSVWGDMPKVIVVEPDAAPALQASIKAGKAGKVDGPDSIMGRLDCKEPSLIALNGLARDADAFVTLSDAEVTAFLPALADTGLATTASGAAGLALVLNSDARAALNIGADARVLTILSEGPE